MLNHHMRLINLKIELASKKERKMLKRKQKKYAKPHTIDTVWSMLLGQVNMVPKIARV